MGFSTFFFRYCHWGISHLDTLYVLSSQHFRLGFSAFSSLVPVLGAHIDTNSLLDVLFLTQILTLCLYWSVVDLYQLHQTFVVADHCGVYKRIRLS